MEAGKLGERAGIGGDCEFGFGYVELKASAGHADWVVQIADGDVLEPRAHSPEIVVEMRKEKGVCIELRCQLQERKKVRTI